MFAPPKRRAPRPKAGSAAGPRRRAGVFRRPSSPAHEAPATPLFLKLSRLSTSRPHDAGEREAHAVARDPGAPAPGAGRGIVRPDRRLASGGEAIPPGLRARAEARLGADLSGVRVHRDGESAALAKLMGARAFTVGADVFMGESEGSPDTGSGRETFLHELAHTVQQQRDGLQIQRLIIVGGEPWFDLAKVREKRKKDPESVEIYLKMRDDPGTFEFPSEEALFREMDLRLWATDMMMRLEAFGEPFATEPGGDECCRYPKADEHFKLNPQHWKSISNKPPIFHLAEKARPSVAVRSIFVPRAGTIIDCGMLIVALRYRALLEVLGSEQFDLVFSREDNPPVISKYHKPSLNPDEPFHPQEAGHVKKEWVPFDPQDPAKHLIPGDQVYFRNHHSYRGRLWFGEHSIYVGNGLFVGFGARERVEVGGSEEDEEQTSDDRSSETTTYVQFAFTHDEIIAKLRAELPEETPQDVQIPGLRSREDPNMIKVRRPSLPGNTYTPAE